MFWPLVLPFQITCYLLAGIVLLVTIFAPSGKLKRVWVFLTSLFLAAVGFIPSCMCIQAIVDSQRFGEFHYDRFSDVNDFRVERYLPSTAQNITVVKYATGHQAKYSISESDLKSYLDGFWEKRGESSVIARDKLLEENKVAPESFKHDFSGVNWPPLDGAIKFSSPIAGNGAHATYYFDQKNGVVYQRAGYW